MEQRFEGFHDFQRPPERNQHAIAEPGIAHILRHFSRSLSRIGIGHLPALADSGDWFMLFTSRQPKIISLPTIRLHTGASGVAALAPHVRWPGKSGCLARQDERFTYQREGIPVNTDW